MRPRHGNTIAVSSFSGSKEIQVRKEISHGLAVEVNALLQEALSDTCPASHQQASSCSSDSFLALLAKCTTSTFLPHGKHIHAHIIMAGLDADHFMSTAVLNMYTKCGSMEDAQHMFDSMPCRDYLLWNMMIAGYSRHGCPADAFQLFKGMQFNKISPTEVTFVSVLKACAGMENLETTKQLHAQIIKHGYDVNVFIGTSFVDIYSKCDCIHDARKVFNSISNRNVVSWSAMIAGYVHCGLSDEAHRLFDQMELRRVKPNEITFVNILKACKDFLDLEKVQQIHKLVIKNGYESNLVIGNALVDVYAKCGSIEKAGKVFSSMPVRNVISWTTMILCNAQHGQIDDAFKLFTEMEGQGIKPNEVTFITLIKLCAAHACMIRGKQIHAYIYKDNLKANLLVENCLIDMYVRCGVMEEAHQLFDQMPVRDVISWSSIIGGYVQHDNPDEAFNLFRQMRYEKVQPNEVTFINVVRACANLASLKKGEQVHDSIIRNGFETYLYVGNTLVDMYCKCGSVHDAYRVFKKMHVRDIVSWNALLAGYSQHGHCEEAFKLFHEMTHEELQFDQVTFLSLLSACRHGGLVEEGRHYFNLMSREHGIKHNAAHCACMVDLLGRAGCLWEAVDFINKASCDTVMVWMALLAACRARGDVPVAELATGNVVRLALEHTAAYVLLSNVYAAAGRWEDKERVWKWLEKRGYRKDDCCNSQ